MRKLIGGVELGDEICGRAECMSAGYGKRRRMAVAPVQLLASSPKPWRKMIVAGEAVEGSGAGMVMGGSFDTATGKIRSSL